MDSSRPFLHSLTPLQVRAAGMHCPPSLSPSHSNSQITGRSISEADPGRRQPGMSPTIDEDNWKDQDVRQGSADSYSFTATDLYNWLSILRWLSNKTFWRMKDAIRGHKIRSKPFSHSKIDAIYKTWNWEGCLVLLVCVTMGIVWCLLPSPCPSSEKGIFANAWSQLKWRLVKSPYLQIILALLDYVSRAHEIEICPSSVRLPSVCLCRNYLWT